MLQHLLCDGQLSQEISGKHCLLSQVHDCTVVGIEAGGLSSRGPAIEVCWERQCLSSASQRGETSSASQRGKRKDIVCVSCVGWSMFLV